MSFWEDFLNIVFIGGVTPVLIYYGFRIGYGNVQAYVAEKYKACTTCPRAVDAIESYKEIECMLKRIADKRFSTLDKKVAAEMMKKTDSTMKEYIRICHALHFEMVVKQVSDKDIESDKVNSAEVIDSFEKKHRSIFMAYLKNL